MTQDFDLARAAEKIISANLERSIIITSVECLTDPERHAAVYRCFAAADNEPERTFIVKMVTEAAFSNADRSSMAEKRFFADWVGAEFLSSIRPEPPISPRFYGGDLNAGFFVIEDLGLHRSLVEPLLNSDSVVAEAALLKYSACLGKLHALTVGKAGVFEALYSTILPGSKPSAIEMDDLEPRIAKFQVLLQQLGIPVSSTLTAEIQEVINVGTRPGPFLSYIHADPCPDNVFDMGDHFRLIVLETGRFGHALWDAVYPRMLWPSCWCTNRLPGEVVARMENRYRAELIKNCPQAQEDGVWETALVNMCGLVLITTLVFSLEETLKEDHEWGIATMRQRVLARLETFITTSEEFRRMPALRGAAHQILPLLQKKWAEIPRLPVYPAFQQARVK